MDDSIVLARPHGRSGKLSSQRGLRLLVESASGRDSFGVVRLESKRTHLAG